MGCRNCEVNSGANSEVKLLDAVVMDSTLEVLFEDAAWKLAELTDAIEACGYDTEGIQAAAAELYEAKTHLRKKVDEELPKGGIGGGWEAMLKRQEVAWERQERGWYTSHLGGLMRERGQKRWRKAAWWFYPKGSTPRLGPYKTLSEAKVAAVASGRDGVDAGEAVRVRDSKAETAEMATANGNGPAYFAIQYSKFILYAHPGVNDAAVGLVRNFLNKAIAVGAIPSMRFLVIELCPLVVVKNESDGTCGFGAFVFDCGSRPPGLKQLVYSHPFAPRIYLAADLDAMVEELGLTRDEVEESVIKTLAHELAHYEQWAMGGVVKEEGVAWLGRMILERCGVGIEEKKE